MLIRLAYDIQFDIPAPVAMVALLNVHPSRAHDLVEPDELQTEPKLEVTHYIDSFGNRCARFVAPAGHLRLSSSTLIDDSGEPDEFNWSAREYAVGDLPIEVLSFLLNSRYCEVDRFSNIALELFGGIEPGWGRVQAICNWVHNKVTSTISRRGPPRPRSMCLPSAWACAATFSIWPSPFAARSIFLRAMPPAIWATSACPEAPMDFSAWFEVYLEGRWWTFDARNNLPRIGRVLMATGRDASDVAITTSFGQADLRTFFVVTEEDKKQESLARPELCPYRLSRV